MVCVSWLTSKQMMIGCHCIILLDNPGPSQSYSPNSLWHLRHALNQVLDIQRTSYAEHRYVNTWDQTEKPFLIPKPHVHPLSLRFSALVVLFSLATSFSAAQIELEWRMLPPFLPNRFVLCCSYAESTRKDKICLLLHLECSLSSCIALSQCNMDRVSV